MLKDPDTTPKRGDRDVVTAAEIGWDRTRQLAKEWTPRADIVKAVLNHSTSPQAIMARQWVRHPTKPDCVVPRTIATTATGCTKAGDAVASTHMVLSADKIFQTFRDLRAQADTIRFGSVTMGLTKGEAEPIFGAVGHMHVLESESFRKANFENISEVKVASSVVRSMREWTRGKDIVWHMLPSMESKRAAAEMREKLAAFEDLEGRILDAEAKGVEPDERLLRRYIDLRVGLDAYWFFIGVHRKIAIEREPTIEAIEAAGNAGLIRR